MTHRTRPPLASDVSNVAAIIVPLCARHELRDGSIR